MLGTLALAAMTLIAGCGGGTGQIEPFAPTRILSFGDEASVITSAGRKYTINAVDDAGALVCANNPIWVQSLATLFGMVFPECNPSNVAAPAGKIYAQVGAKVAQVATQVDAHFATSGFGSKDLVSIMAGANDVLELYALYPAQGESSLLAQVGERGKALADQVNRIANAGGKVIVVTLPDLGLSPFALAEKVAKPDTDRARLLTALTTEFNTQMRLRLINDGRMIGLVLGDEMSQAIVKYPGAFAYENVTEAACASTAPLPDCTSKTLVTNGNGDTWLWASGTMLSPAGQARLGSLAQNRARNNPF